ncbi:MAG TPA: NAD(P)(+) transhydrogenase (Re/Si-specific) subunit beta [Gemmatimonadales bacterium]|nr:NAD(P)(+) transhydrogenase (Re/Si-specific) subunit beta [Gemmatimonadales bacterium]
MLHSLTELAYLAAAIMFVTGLKWMSSPARARRGNMISSVGMLIAVLATLISQRLGYGNIIIGAVIGSGLGLWMARAVPMTSMPQMVGILNGFGGGASLLVAAAEWRRLIDPSIPFQTDTAVSIWASTLVGGVTFAGSAVAAGKLQEIISGKPVLFRGQHALNALLVAAALTLATLLTLRPEQPVLYVALVALSLVLGITLVIPIGGADMPVVICLLNSYSGIAAALTGFVIRNDGLIITGALVGASGLILTKIMCEAMNRSLANVLFGGFGATVQVASEREKALQARGVKRITVEDAAALLAYSRNVMVAPGYGLAVAQGQHQVQELATLLEKRGVSVKYAIHPVAGRMPGHMNVLLAEANVPYPLLLDMDAANPEFERCDVALVVGANDVVNPAARNNPSSPIYGMPILDVDKAKQIIVMKRSMNPGFAGIENELFYHERCSMLFGDAKKSLTALINEVRTLE